MQTLVSWLVVCCNLWIICIASPHLGWPTPFVSCIFYRCSRVKVIWVIASRKHFSPCMCECAPTKVCGCVSLSGFLVNTKSIFPITFFLFSAKLCGPLRSRLRSPSLGTSALNIFHKFCFGFVFLFLFLGVKLSKMHRKTTTRKNKFDGKLQFGWARDSVSQYGYDDCGNGDHNDGDDSDDDDSDECDCELELNVEL